MASSQIYVSTKSALWRRGKRNDDIDSFYVVRTTCKMLPRALTLYSMPNDVARISYFFVDVSCLILRIFFLQKWFDYIEPPLRQGYYYVVEYKAYLFLVFFCPSRSILFFVFA